MFDLQFVLIFWNPSRLYLVETNLSIKQNHLLYGLKILSLHQTHDHNLEHKAEYISSLSDRSSDEAIDASAVNVGVIDD